MCAARLGCPQRIASLPQCPAPAMTLISLLCVLALGWKPTQQPSASPRTSRPPERRVRVVLSEEENTAVILRKALPFRKRVPWALGDMHNRWATRCHTALTRAWLRVPSNLSRPWFETSFETNWPVYGKRQEAWPEKCGAHLEPHNITFVHRCEKLQELDPARHWVVLDSVPVPPTHGPPLSVCAPPWVTVACMSCYPAWLRPELDTALPPPTFSRDSGVYVSSREEVLQRCHAPNNAAIGFQGRMNDRKRMHFRVLDGTLIRGLGRVRVVATNSTPSKLADHTHSSFEHLLRTSHFGFAPRGDARFSYRFSELAASAVLPITFNDWALPFPQLINWDSIGIILNASTTNARIEKEEIASLPARLAKLSLQEVCRRRVYLFDVYQRYLKGPKEWEAALREIVSRQQLRKRRRPQGNATKNRLSDRDRRSHQVYEPS